MIHVDKEVLDLFEDRKRFETRPDIFEKMVKDREKRQRTILQEIEEHGNGDKAFVIGASYILEVCSRAVELFEAKSSQIEQKRFLIDFVLSSMTWDFTLKEPFEAIAEMAKTGNLYAR